MQLAYTNHDGQEVVVDVTEKPLSLGRSFDADVVLQDEKVSVAHCEIRFWSGDYVIKDLHSHNGTYVNGARIDVAQLRPGDRIQCGDQVLRVPASHGKGSSTIIRELQEEMDHEAKGFKTMMKEIVDSAEGSAAPE
jgi:pSer/pThr/pTyr-binding forkhead associated (FHA) protein